ncbi:MAG: nucleoside hydrolase [Anaerolineaceae bacterium]|jgi:uridine nucleosidase|nr:nucleoside hydrolase [Anaerolineaceae bacterium]
MAKKIIFDTDPGVDDAMALTFALRSPELEVVGVTTVFGNAAGPVTALNALRLVELEGNDHIPVARGADRAVVLPAMELGTMVHGEDGMGNTNPPPPKGKLLDIHAAEFIVETVLANPGEITLMPVGPLTNIALALRLEPRIVDLVAEVVLMGGAAYVPGNITPLAEANVYHDPHAAQMVFSADWQVTMVGLDVTHQVVMDNAYFDRLLAARNPAVDLIRKILPCYQSFFDVNYGANGSIFTNDPSAVMYAIRPDLFAVHKFPVVVETEGRCMGKTIVDAQNRWVDYRASNVCVGVDAPNFLDIYLERMTK